MANIVETTKENFRNMHGHKKDIGYQDYVDEAEKTWRDQV